MHTLSCFFVLLLFFLTGCTAYDQLKHKQFSMDIPQWDHQERLDVLGVAHGYYLSDAHCALNITISQDPYLRVAQAVFSRIQLLDSEAAQHYQLRDTSAVLDYHYTSSGTSGKVEILSCSNKYVYAVDYTCPEKFFKGRQTERDHIFQSLICT